MLEKLVAKFSPRFSFDRRVNVRQKNEILIVNIIRLLRGLFIQLLNFKWPALIFVGRGVIFRSAANIQLGRGVKIGDFAVISGLGDRGVILGDGVGIGSFSQVICSTTYSNIGKHIIIGSNVGFGEFAYLGGAGGLEIGSDTIIGQYFSAHPENHDFDDENELLRYQGVSRKGIKIGCNCWLGSKVTVLDGVELGDRCVVAAGSVVNKSFPSGSVIGGVPARLLRSMNAT